jgi:hypothetical protein
MKSKRIERPNAARLTIDLWVSGGPLMPGPAIGPTTAVLGVFREVKVSREEAF